MSEEAAVALSPDAPTPDLLAAARAETGAPAFGPLIERVLATPLAGVVDGVGDREGRRAGEGADVSTGVVDVLRIALPGGFLFAVDMVNTNNPCL